MNNDLFLALVLFAFVSSITPGPNNLMLMASGANFGFRRTIPHMLGVGLGFVLMILLLGAGLVQVFDAFPVTYDVLKIASVVYLLYLAFKIATAAPVRRQDTGGAPMTFLQAAAFQWVNPKAWAMALTAISAYTPSQSFGAVVLVALIFGAVNIPSVGSWTILGQQIARFLTSSARLTAFNWTMAALLVASLYPILSPIGGVQ
ncbi:LysE family translocator [Sedimentitalea nanhaiensis]|uniref:Threonine/homoserine/homoserine lactone efflux protein n=1 Tax=Sedimentitalea nanhaiensis TaxID=999627 RepID=A0A1I7BRD3_9RHOB|nr:LysE family translocator [Sedimentitalea nanhaiensis]SFT89757.1 Threonine/homoserine/homoserine lactone efflux protein [Sedimentitalea nanhaiensis]